MKAIQIKYLGVTDTKPSRLKAMVEGMEASFVEEIDHSLDIVQQARRMAERVILNLHWDVVITGEGIIPNGDWVFTIGDKPESYICPECGEESTQAEILDMDADCCRSYLADCLGV